MGLSFLPFKSKGNNTLFIKVVLKIRLQSEHSKIPDSINNGEVLLYIYIYIFIIICYMYVIF